MEYQYLKPLTPCEIKGNCVAKRALEIAQASDLSVLFVGPRGSSKSTLRAAFPDVRTDERDSCMCGNWQSITRECVCNPRLLYRWYRRLERLAAGFDLVIETCHTPAKEMLGRPNDPKDDEYRAARVAAAREYGSTHHSLKMDDAATRTMEMVIRRLAITNGQHQQILKVSRAIANLDASEHLKAKHVAEATQYRGDATMLRPERLERVTA